MTMTAEDLAAMPADVFRYELVRGELILLPLAFHQHGAVGARFKCPFRPLRCEAWFGAGLYGWHRVSARLESRHCSRA